MPDKAQRAILSPALEAALDTVPDDRLLAFLKNGPWRPRGFRLVPQSLPGLRDWLVKRVLGHADVPEPLLELLAESSPPSTLVRVLSTAVLVETLEALDAVLGRGVFCLALLLDERALVRELSNPLLDASDSPLIDKETARVVLGSFLSPLLLVAEAGTFLSEGVSDPSDGATKLPSTVVPSTGDGSETSHREGRRVRALEKRLEQAREALEKSRREREERSRAMDELRQELVSRASRVDALENECKSLRGEMANQVEREVALRLNDAAYVWTQPLRQVEQAARVSENDSELVMRVEHVLCRQAEHDRHSGNRTVLQKRRERLLVLRAELLDARRSALHPLPELVAHQRDTDAEIDRLDTLLGSEDAPSAPAMRLAANINTATPDALPGWADRLREMFDGGLFTSSERKLLEATLSRRQGMLHAGNLPVTPKDAAPDDPVARLSLALRGGAGLRLLLDGHNVLFSLTARYGGDFDEGNKPGARAREHLIYDLRRMVREHPACRVDIVFDGPEAAEHDLLPNLRVVYSGGEGDHRADRVLIETTRYLARGPSAVTVIVVSNDRDVEFRARGYGALSMTAAMLDRFL